MGGKSQDPNKAAMKFQKEQMKRLEGIDLPELQEYILQNPELVGLLEAEQLGDSALEEISLDPQLREQQLAALENLKEYADTGLTETDKYAMEQMLGDVASQEQASQAAIEDKMARQGMDSSGAALMAKMQARQEGANRGREQAMQMASQGQQNRMAALNQLAGQSGQMQQADYSRQAQTASARDAIARANAANRQNVNAQNLAARQAIENQRANISNLQAQVGNQINQQNFQNQLSRATGQGSTANAMSNIAGNAQQGPSGLQTIGTIGGGIVGGIYGGPAGAAAGASAGGAIGGALSAEDGGVIKKYADPKSVHYNNKNTPIFNENYYKMISGENDVDQTIEASGGKRLGIDNDMTSAEVQTNQDAKQALGNQDQGMSAQDMTKALGALNSIMGKKEGESKPRLKLGQFSMSQPENVMNPVGPQNFANPYAAADGGIPKELQSPDREAEVNRMLGKPEDNKLMMTDSYENGGVPEYACGGTHNKPEFASGGIGEIVDSGMDSYAGDRIDAKINDGEMILNVPQQQRLMDVLRGEESLDNLGDSDIIEGVPSDYRDELHEMSEESDEENESSKRVKGLKALLEALGDE